MPQTAAEIAKDLTIAAIQAHPKVVEPRAPGATGDETALATQVAAVFTKILSEIKSEIPG
jgi:hypothetical protein